MTLSGARIAAFSPERIHQDPTLAPWLFIILSQVHIWVALMSAGLPAIKRTILDLTTNFGVSGSHQDDSKRGVQYILSSLTKKSKRSHKGSNGTNRFPFSGSLNQGSTVIRAGHSHAPSEDGDSQTGIVRRDEFDVVITDARRYEPSHS
jgi:hypothetical protein